MLAFEPQQKMFQHLHRAAKAGDWGKCNWRGIKAAMSAKPGKLVLYGDTTHASLGKKSAWAGHEVFGSSKTETVEVMTLDAVVNGAWRGALS